MTNPIQPSPPSTPRNQPIRLEIPQAPKKAIIYQHPPTNQIPIIPPTTPN